MNIAEKLTQIVENIPKVYEAGKNTMWDIVQDNGNKNNYRYAFCLWSIDYIRPKYKVVPTDPWSGVYTFYKCKELKKVEKLYFDFSHKEGGANSNFGYNYMFDSCIMLEEIEDIGLIPQYSYTRTFGYCYKLHTIEKLGVDANTKFNDAFIDCRELVNLTIDGTIGQNGFDIHYSTKISADSLVSIINALSSTTTGLTVTLPTTAQSNYEAIYGEGAWATLIATKSNWTVTLL